MIERKKCTNYYKRAKYVRGLGFRDIFNSIGSYIGQNKDLVAKPLLSAAGNALGYAVQEGSKALMQKIIAKKLNNPNKEILEKIANKPVENITGSGIKKF